MPSLKPMMLEADPEWQVLHPNRSCGDCHACCIHLGITELRKYTSQSCKHLDGTIPSKRCTIYDTRPDACITYKCLWLQGISPDNLRPHDCGILITSYDEDMPPGRLAFTVTVFDPTRAKPHLDSIIAQLLLMPITQEIRILYPAARKAFYFKDGFIYQCKLLQTRGNYEALSFEAYHPPIGQYATPEISSLPPALRALVRAPHTTDNKSSQ